MLPRLAFSQRPEITQTSVVALDRKTVYRDTFWLPIRGPQEGPLAWSQF